MKQTQKERILADLKMGDRLSHLDALDRYGCARLAARISDLKKEGWRIESEMVQSGDKRYARYHLLDPWTQDEYEKRLEDARDITTVQGELL